MNTQELRKKMLEENLKWKYKPHIVWGCKLCKNLSNNIEEAEDHAWTKHKGEGTGQYCHYHNGITYIPCHREDYESYGTDLIFNNGFGWQIINNENPFTSIWHYLTRLEAKREINRLDAQRAISRMKDLLIHINELNLIDGFDKKFMLFAWENFIQKNENDLTELGCVRAFEIDGQKGIMHQEIIRKYNLPLYITIRQGENIYLEEGQ